MNDGAIPDPQQGPTLGPQTGGARTQPRDAANWAGHGRGAALRVSEIAPEAVSLNVEGRRVVGPLQGFGQLWQKTYRLPLAGIDTTAAAVVGVLKERLPLFQPAQNRFFPSVAGVRPGEVVLINASLNGMRLDTGVLVLYADDESFTLMTPQGHPESGWVTFSAYEDAGVVMVQIQSIARANDPLYEIGFRLAGSRAQEQIWTHVLTALAAHYQVASAVTVTKTCVDPRCQWSQSRNIWYNAAIRTGIYTTLTPARWLRSRLGRR